MTEFPEFMKLPVNRIATTMITDKAGRSGVAAECVGRSTKRPSLLVPRIYSLRVGSSRKRG